jgi:hypothetical protein
VAKPAFQSENPTDAKRPIVERDVGIEHARAVGAGRRGDRRRKAELGQRENRCLGRTVPRSELNPAVVITDVEQAPPEAGWIVCGKSGRCPNRQDHRQRIVDLANNKGIGKRRVDGGGRAWVVPCERLHSANQRPARGLDVELAAEQQEYVGRKPERRTATGEPDRGHV